MTPGTAPTLQDLLRFKLLMMLLLPTFGKPYRVNETTKLYIYDFKINKKFTGDKLVVTYCTPFGELSTETKLDQPMKEQGITIAAKIRKSLNSIKDFKAAQYFRNPGFPVQLRWRYGFLL